MTKIELHGATLHGATLPDGWTVETSRPHADLLIISRNTPGAKWPGGMVTIDMRRRIFNAGDVIPVRHVMPASDGGRSEYRGRNWQKRIIQDSCGWLEKTMT